MGTATLIISVQVLLSLLMLMFNRVNKRDDHYLSIFLVAIAVHLFFKMGLLYLLDDTFLFENFSVAFTLLYGPLFLFHYFEVYQIKTKAYSKVLHIMPFVLALVFNAIAVFRYWSFGDKGIIETQTGLLKPLFGISLISYMGFVFFSSLKNGRESEKEDRLRKKIILAIAVPFFVTSVIQLVLWIIGNRFSPIFDSRYFVVLALMVSLFLLLHFRFRLQMASLTNISKNTLDPVIKRLKREKAEEELLVDSEEFVRISKKLQHFIVVKKIYKDEDLTLTKLADRMELPKHHLSEVFNHHLKTTFYKYINGFRVEEAKRILASNDDVNFLDVCHDSGFKSKSTFNKYFKEITGLAPSDFKAFS